MEFYLIENLFVVVIFNIGATVTAVDNVKIRRSYDELFRVVLQLISLYRRLPIVKSYCHKGSQTYLL